MDHTDCIRRHMLDIADMVAAFERAQAMAAQYGANEFIDSGGPEHLTVLIAAILDEANALAWRALAYSQMLHETYGGAPLAPAARNVPTDPNAMCDAIDAYGGERCTRSAGHSGAHHSALTDFSFPEPAPLSPEEHVMLHGASDVLVVRAREHTCAIGSDEPCAVCDETAPPPVLDNDPDDPVRGFDAAD
jgi:hypothetical protein